MMYNINAEVYAVENNFFGGEVSVSGLICGSDLIEQLKSKEFDRLLITKSMLKADEPIFLDDVTVKEAEKALNTEIIPVENDGYDFVKKVLGEE